MTISSKPTYGPRLCFPQSNLGPTLNQAEFCFGATITRINGFR